MPVPNCSYRETISEAQGRFESRRRSHLLDDYNDVRSAGNSSSSLHRSGAHPATGPRLPAVSAATLGDIAEALTYCLASGPGGMFASLTQSPLRDVYARAVCDRVPHLAAHTVLLTYTVNACSCHVHCMLQDTEFLRHLLALDLDSLPPANRRRLGVALRCVLSLNAAPVYSHLAQDGAALIRAAAAIEHDFDPTLGVHSRPRPALAQAAAALRGIQVVPLPEALANRALLLQRLLFIRDTLLGEEVL